MIYINFLYHFQIAIVIFKFEIGNRDIAKNWNIDIAHDLEEYLSELETISISFDGGKTSLNFAEAALLIQGSACIYR